MSFATKEELQARLVEIENTFSVFYSLIYPAFTAEKKEHVSLSNAEIEALAEAVSAEAGAKANALRAEKTETLRRLNNQAGALVNAREEEIAAAGARFAEKMAELEADTLARGMGKSSFYLQKKSELLAAKLAEENAARARYNALAADKTAEIAGETARFDAAIAAAEGAYHAAVAAKKEELARAERDHAEQVLEYNNEQSLKEAEFGRESRRQEFDRANDVQTVSRLSMTYQKTEACKEYLDSMTASDAVIDMVENKVFYTTYLGKAGYDALYTHYLGEANSVVYPAGDD